MKLLNRFWPVHRIAATLDRACWYVGASWGWRGTRDGKPGGALLHIYLLCLSVIVEFGREGHTGYFPGVMGTAEYWMDRIDPPRQTWWRRNQFKIGLWLCPSHQADYSRLTPEAYWWNAVGHRLVWVGLRLELHFGFCGIGLYLSRRGLERRLFAEDEAFHAQVQDIGEAALTRLEADQLPAECTNGGARL